MVPSRPVLYYNPTLSDEALSFILLIDIQYGLYS